MSEKLEPTAMEIERVDEALKHCQDLLLRYDINRVDGEEIAINALAILARARAAILAMDRRASLPVPAVAGPAAPHIDGNQWVAGRDAFVKYADRYAAANKHEGAMAIADVAPAEIFKSMLAAAPEPVVARSPSEPLSARTQGVEVGR